MDVPNPNIGINGTLKSSQTSLCTSDIELHGLPSGEAQSEKSTDKPKSRFKVAKVDFVDEKQPDSKKSDQQHHHHQATTGSESHSQDGYPSPSKSAGSGSASPVGAEDSIVSGSISPPSPTHRDSTTIGQDTTNLKTFGHNTTEALPHVDHYRNLLSATTALRSRPTLQELHEGHDVADKVRKLM
jgi:hypothetical protein